LLEFVVSNTPAQVSNVQIHKTEISKILNS
jgi:hypothetical protein